MEEAAPPQIPKRVAGPPRRKVKIAASDSVKHLDLSALPRLPSPFQEEADAVARIQRSKQRIDALATLEPVVKDGIATDQLTATVRPDLVGVIGAEDLMAAHQDSVEGNAQLEAARAKANEVREKLDETQRARLDELRSVLPMLSKNFRARNAKASEMMRDGILTDSDHSFRDYRKRTRALQKHIGELCAEMEALIR